MDGQKYNQHIEDLLMEVKKRVNQTSDERFNLCVELYQEAEKQKDSYLLGIAGYHLGEYCYKQRESESSFTYLSRANQHLKESEEWELLCRSYDMIGLLLQFKGNFMQAIDYFTEGIKIAQEHGLMGRVATLCQNFSSLCESVQDYEQALQYREMALVIMQGYCDEENKEELSISIRAMMVRLYMKMGQVRNAAVEMKRLDAELEKHPQAADLFEVLAVRLEYAKRTQNKKKAGELKGRALKAFFEYTYILEYFDACMILTKYLFDEQDYTALEEVLDVLESSTGADGYVELYMQASQYRIEMYKQQNRMEELAKTTYVYFEKARIRRTEMKKSYCSVLKLRNELRQEEVNNIFLTLKAGTDELSGIPNRRKLNEEADRLFEKAYKERKTLGVEMLDIDHFKDCNDNYGHQMGDRCIRRVADALKDITNRNIFCARYGGDEFVVLYYDMSDGDILECCNSLQKSAYRIGEELGINGFTISQGVVNTIPTNESRIWDYTAAADDALYWVKDQGRDDIRLVHSRNEV